MTYIVASLVERSVSGVSDSSRKAFREGADLVEVRLDHLRIPRFDAMTLSKVREAVRGPAIATLRSSEEGGRSRLRGGAREKALRAVLGAGFEYVDLELQRDGRLLGELRRRERKPSVIASFHFGRPAAAKDVEKALTRACKAGDFGKVAMPCEDAGQALMLASLGLRHSAAGDSFVLIGMGDQGQLTRVCARQMGSSMVYCSLKGKPAAPGQLDIGSQSSLDNKDRFILGLLGHPVHHSVSKPMQEAALHGAGLAGTYLNLDLPPEALGRDTLKTFRRLGFSGINVTIPHKQKVHALCDHLDPEAVSTGAVNTVKFEGTHIHGKNTDIIGFMKAIEPKTHIGSDTEALVVGAGGAARAAALGLARAGAHVTVAARDPKKGARMAKEMGIEAMTTEALRRTKKTFHVVVNCTPLGTDGVGGAAPVPARLFKHGVVFFDMVYNPRVTRSMRFAAARKAKALGGLDMLVNQGAESFRSWTGIEPDVDVMRSAARRALS